MDKQFWEERYEHDPSIPSTPSRFAEWCIESGKIKTNDLVLEIGHGNGRDAFFLAKSGVRVVGIDQAGKTWVNGGKLRLMRGDFTSGPEVMATLLKVLKEDLKVDHVYSRFTWHSINREDEQKVLGWLPNALRPGGSVLIECRTVFDEIYGLGEQVERDAFIFNDHFRRFIRPGVLFEEMLKRSFRVTAEVSKGFAPYHEEDPLILRLQGIVSHGNQPQ